MTSKAAKLRVKRSVQSVGRPRKQDAERYPCGKIKQDWSKRESEKEARATVIEARQRIHGVTKAQAGSMLSGSVLGLLYLDNRITEQEMKAGDRYAEKMAKYYGLTGIPFPSPKAQEMFSVGGYDGETSAERAEAARDAANVMMNMEGALLRCHDGPQVNTTVRNVCLLDNDYLRSMPEKQLEWLRSGLRSLMLFFGVASERQIR